MTRTPGAVELRAAQILCVDDEPCERHLLDAYSLRMAGVLAERILPLGEDPERPRETSTLASQRAEKQKGSAT